MKVTKKQLLVTGGVVLLLGGAAAFGILTSKLLPPTAKKEATPTISGLPKDVDDVQNLRLQGKTEEAAKKADTIISQAGTSDDTKYVLYLDKGNGSLDTKNYAAALDSYTKAAAIKQTSNVYTLIGQTYYYMGKKADAKTAYQKAITLIDKNSPVADSDKLDLQQRIDIIDGKTE